MKLFVAAVATILLTFGHASASDNLLGNWSSGASEVLTVSGEAGALQAVFTRLSVVSKFEKVSFPAKIHDGALVISSEQGDLSARYDETRQQLILGGVKAFRKLSSAEALLLIEEIKKEK